MKYFLSFLIELWPMGVKDLSFFDKSGFSRSGKKSTVGEGEGGKIWENGIETYIISCMKRVASPGSMHDTGCLGLVHWDDPEG